uniref:VWFA domain-containing protein n=1 Tax=Arion vulgaris TaxID=1028688 RepID=A0A0B7A964_9EUPU
MKVLFLALLTLALVGHINGGFLGLVGNIVVGGIDFGLGMFGKIFDVGLTFMNSVIVTGVNIGGATIGAVVDPFGIWRGTEDDHGHKSGKVEKCPAIADIIYVFDTSTSTSASEFELQKQFAIRITEHFKIGASDTRFGAIVFSDTAEVTIRLSEYKDGNALTAALQNTKYLGGGTSTYHALDLIRTGNLFNTSNGARVKSSKIVMVITDGSSDSLFKTNAAASALKSTGVQVISVGIGSGFGIELSNIASGYRNVFTADSFKALSRVEHKIARRTCEIPAAEGNIPSGSGEGGKECPKGYERNPKDKNTCIDVNECNNSKQPCQEVCVNLIGSYRCKCKPGQVVDEKATTKCIALPPCTKALDIIFVLDASGSIGVDNWAIQQDFVARLITHFTVGESAAQFGALTFSQDVVQLFYLYTYSSAADITSAVVSANYTQGITNTHKAFNAIYQYQLFSSKSGGRSNAPDVVVVLTDGESSQSEATKSSANRLKQAGIRIVPVGISASVNPTELQAIASNAKETVLVGDFDLLDYIEQRVTNIVCSR